MDANTQQWKLDQTPLDILDLALERIRNTSDDHIARIKGLASLVRDNATDDAESDNQAHVGRWAEKIMHSAACLQRSLDHLSLLGGGNVAQAPQRSNWRDVLRCVGESCAYHTTAHIDIRNRTSDRPFVQHRELMIGVLSQIVANAAESKVSGASVVVEVSEQWVGVREFVIEITDNGDGIHASRARGIWDPFHTTKRGHIGLGLPYVARVVPIIGTPVDVRSTPGVGTRVTMAIRDKGEPNHVQ